MPFRTMEYISDHAKFLHHLPPPPHYIRASVFFLRLSHTHLLHCMKNYFLRAETSPWRLLLLKLKTLLEDETGRLGESCLHCQVNLYQERNLLLAGRELVWEWFLLNRMASDIGDLQFEQL